MDSTGIESTYEVAVADITRLIKHGLKANYDKQSFYRIPVYISEVEIIQAFSSESNISYISVPESEIHLQFNNLGFVDHNKENVIASVQL